MGQTIHYNFDEIKLTDDEYEDLFSILDVNILEIPFKQSESLFKKHFSGFRINKINVKRFQNAIIKEIEKENLKLANFYYSGYLDIKINKNNLSLSPLFKKLLLTNPENLQILLNRVENDQDEIREKIKEAKNKNENNKKLILKRMEGKKNNINQANEQLVSILQDLDSVQYEYQSKLNELTKNIQSQNDIIQVAKNTILELENKKKDIKKSLDKDKSKLNNKEISLKNRIEQLDFELQTISEKKDQDDCKEIELLNNNFSENENKIEALKKLCIEIENLKLEKSDCKDTKGQKSTFNEMVKLTKIDLSGYYNWPKFSNVLEKLNSPLQKFEFRRSYELIPSAKRGEDLSAITVEAFTGWKITERDKNYTDAMEYFSKFIFLQGFESLKSGNYINARLFFMASAKINHEQIGQIEQSQQLRDHSVALQLYSFLREQGYEKYDNYLDLLDSSFGNYSFSSTLESLVAHNMLQQIVDTIDDLCSTSVPYTLQIFSDFLVSDTHLFSKTYRLLVNKLVLNNKSLGCVLLGLLKKYYRYSKLNELFNIIEKDLMIGTLSDNIEDKIDKIPTDYSEAKERINIFLNSVFQVKVQNKGLILKRVKNENVLLRNLTTNLPLREKTSIVIEVSNNSEYPIQNCTLIIGSKEKNVKVENRIRRITKLGSKSSSEYEFDLILNKIYCQIKENKHALFSINLTMEKDGKQEQLQLIDNSKVFFQCKTTEPNFYFTDGKPTQLKRNMIFGRDKDFDKIENALRGQETDNTLMIFGERGIGKTTIWKVLAQDFLMRHYNLIDIDCEGRGNEKKFYKKIANEICSALKIDAKILHNFDWKDDIVDDLIDLFDDLGQKYIPNLKSTKKIMLVIDEFNALTDKVLRGEWDPNFLGFLRQLMTRHSSWISVILCGTPSYREIMKNYNDALYREGYPLLLSRLSKDDTEKLIKQNATNVEFHPKAIKAIINSVGTNPHYVHKFCRKLMEILISNPRGKDGKLLCIENDVLKNEEICIEEDFITFQNLLQIRDKDNIQNLYEIEVLSALAEVSKSTSDFIGIESIKAFYRQHKLQIPKTLVQDLAVLGENKIVESDVVENETCFRIAPKMFKLWLIKNKSFKSLAIDRASKESEAAEIIEREKISIQSKMILKILFLKRDWLSIDPKKLSSGLSKAETFVVETQTRLKESGRPYFVKIGQYELVEEEIKNHKLVEKFELKIPTLLKVSANSPGDALCECEKNCPGKKCQSKYLGAIFEFAKSSAGGQVKELGEVIRMPDYNIAKLKEDLITIFKFSLGNLYNNLELKSKELKSLGYRCITNSGINEVKSQFKYIMHKDMCVPNFDDNNAEFISNNPIMSWNELIKTRLNKKGEVIVGKSHQDLHLQNIMKDNNEVFWIIDWLHFKAEGHLVKDFTGIVADIIVSLDYTKDEALELAEKFIKITEKDELLTIKDDLPTFSHNVSIALSAILTIQEYYQDIVLQSVSSIHNARITGEFNFSLYLNLLATACKPNASKFGKELCVFYAGLLEDQISEYVKMTF